MIKIIDIIRQVEYNKEKFQYNRFIKNKHTLYYYDKKSKILWPLYPLNIKLTYDQGEEYIKYLGKDWIIPDIDEFKWNLPDIIKKNLSGKYWSSTTSNRSNESKYVYVYGFIKDIDRNEKCYIWPVKKK